TRGGDQRGRRLQDLVSASSIYVGTSQRCAGVFHRSSPRRCHVSAFRLACPRRRIGVPCVWCGYGVMPSRLQIPKTSSKIDVGTVNGSVADTSLRCVAMSSAVGLLPGCASQPSLSPTKTRAKRPAPAE